MLRRLIVGLLIGLLIGSAIGVGLIQGLGVVTLGAALAYVSAALTGALVGLVAGKPIWSPGGQIEAGLKAVFGAILAAGGMFALRQWVTTELDLPALPAVGALHGHVGELPLLALPLLGAILGGFYGVDNTPEPAASSAKTAKTEEKALAAAPSKTTTVSNAKATNGKARVAAVDTSALEDDDVAAPPSRARR